MSVTEALASSRHCATCAWLFLAAMWRPVWPCCAAGVRLPAALWRSGVCVCVRCTRTEFAPSTGMPAANSDCTHSRSPISQRRSSSRFDYATAHMLACASEWRAYARVARRSVASAYIARRGLTLHGWHGTGRRAAGREARRQAQAGTHSSGRRARHAVRCGAVHHRSLLLELPLRAIERRVLRKLGAHDTSTSRSRFHSSLRCAVY
mgnify:CR=1 FL=1